jgi:hypothetical protein
MAYVTTTNGGVALNWAAQKRHARSNNGNFRFEGDFLYSYSTIIGVLHRHRIFGPVALMTSRTFSVTTSAKHWGPALSALRSYEIRYHVVPSLHPPDHELNVNWLRDMYVDALERLRSTQRHRMIGNWECDQIRGLVTNLRNYCADFDIIIPEIHVEAAIKEALDAHSRRREQYLSPSETELRTRRQAKANLRRLVGI